ncbi:MAG TPA: hypothetical protein VJK72_03900 [Candidatus Nanoarchaeia archaeon]|nr:hypothetical protein [Candidatus Nanoarchaeia archaeon]
MPLIRELHDLEEENADRKRENEQEKIARIIKRKIIHLQHEKQRVENEIKLLEKKCETLHKQKRNFRLWWYTRKLRIKKIKLDSLKKITPSAKL